MAHYPLCHGHGFYAEDHVLLFGPAGLNKSRDNKRLLRFCMKSLSLLSTKALFAGPGLDREPSLWLVRMMNGVFAVAVIALNTAASSEPGNSNNSWPERITSGLIESASSRVRCQIKSELIQISLR